MPCWIGYSAIPLRRFRKPITMRGEIHLKCGACMGGEADRMPLGEVVAGGPWMRIDPGRSAVRELAGRDRYHLGIR